MSMPWLPAEVDGFTPHCTSLPGCFSTCPGGNLPRFTFLVLKDPLGLEYLVYLPSPLIPQDAVALVLGELSIYLLLQSLGMLWLWLWVNYVFTFSSNLLGCCGSGFV